MSESCYCSVCLDEVLEIKSEDLSLKYIGDMKIICKECAEGYRINVEKIINKVWVIYEKCEPIGVYENKPSCEFLELLEKRGDTKLDIKEIEVDNFEE